MDIWHVMKAIGILLVLLVTLAAGCTPALSIPTLEKPSIPTTGPEPTPAAEPVPPESKDAAAQFVWTVDPGIRLEDATVPNICRLEDGRIRMYYGGPGGILSAISDDGLTFSKEVGVRVPSGSQNSPEMIVSDPT